MRGGRLVAEGTNGKVRGGDAPDLRVVTTFEEVYRTMHARMVRVAFMMTGSTEAAEDVVQDAFVGLYARFDRLADPVPYLYRSVVNACSTRHRRVRTVERLGHLAAGKAVDSFEIDETWGALKDLAPRRRAVIVLRYYADLRLSDIAQILGCKTGTVKSIQHRALAELKEVLGT
jgi:RNA polymerase sigma factor (sigma-70 family)